jgi:hypothetical protein
MTNDPLIDKLARFTPSAATVDNSALLFAAGRASARTPAIWKLAVAGLLLTNAGWVSVLASLTNREAVHDTSPQTTPAIPVQSEPVLPPSSNTPPPSDEPWNYRNLMSIDDPGKLPESQPLQNPIPNERPLTSGSAMKGEID